MQNTPCERPNGASHADAHTWRCHNPDECRTPEVCGGHRSESRGVEPIFLSFFPLFPRFSPLPCFQRLVGGRRAAGGEEGRRGDGGEKKGRGGEGARSVARCSARPVNTGAHSISRRPSDATSARPASAERRASPPWPTSEDLRDIQLPVM